MGPKASDSNDLIYIRVVVYLSVYIYISGIN